MYLVVYQLTFQIHTICIQMQKQYVCIGMYPKMHYSLESVEEETIIALRFSCKRWPLKRLDKIFHAHQSLKLTAPYRALVHRKSYFSGPPTARCTTSIL